MKTTLLLLGILFACMGFARAYPALVVPTNGLVTLPTADTQDMGTLSLAADWYNVSETFTISVGEGTDTVDIGDAIPLRLVYGLPANLEIGVGYALQDINDDARNTWSANAKIRSPLGLGGFSWAGGAVYAVTNSDPENMNTTQLYLAGTRNFTKPIAGAISLKGTIGVNWTRVDPGIGESVDGIRAFAGLEAGLINRVSLVAEYQTKNSDLDLNAISSIALRFAPTETMAVQFGFTNSGGFTGLEDHNLFAGVNVALGGQ